MTSSTAPEAAHSAPGLDAELADLEEIIDHAGHLLPAQGPITVFIHHNTLHALEHLPFNEALAKGAEIFGCQPYLSEERYRQELVRGRIRYADLREALVQDLGADASREVPCFGTRLELRLDMLEHPPRSAPTDELIWFVAEADALRRVRPEVSAADRARLIAETRRWVVRDLRTALEPGRNGESGPGVPGSFRRPGALEELLDRFDDSRMEHWSESDWEGFTVQALWRLCCDGVRDLPPFTAPPPEPLRHRDLLLEATGADSDRPVHELLIRFCAAYLDQGMARWAMPGREDGFYRAFCDLYGQPFGPPDRWMKGLHAELSGLMQAGVGPLESIRRSLRALGVPPQEWEAFVSKTLLALRGWAGMIRVVELRGDRVVQPIPAGSLVEFLAVRLILDRHALAWTAQEALGEAVAPDALRDVCRRMIRRPGRPGVERRAFPLFQLVQLRGLPPDVLYRLEPSQWRAMLEEVESFGSFERRRVYHLAYERRFYTQAADAIALHVRRPAPTPSWPRFQAVFCIDDREESIRRHLEEVAPDVVTYGTAGFFSVPMYYLGAADAHFAPLCPGSMQPRNWVVEEVVDANRAALEVRQRVRRALGMATYRFDVGSRSLTLGAFLAAIVGVLASIPLVARTLFPRMTARVTRRLGRIVDATPQTRLRLERAGGEPGPATVDQGFTIGEMAEIAEKVLREIGMTRDFSRLVFAIGHGSSTVNNPHASAYDCGACGGSRGGPNARAFAQMLNHPGVREILAGRGVSVPDGSRFVGAMHNTTSESITFYDADLLPQSHVAEFESFRTLMEAAAARNAHERSRRFQSASLALSFEGARQHVEGRSEDLAQVRPEWGHATNALCVVGRRETTRGLFLDRRAFLTSYDSSQDDEEGTILLRILRAIFPVCGGISLEYYFSHVDNAGWGAGTKLPHNVSSLLGVMDGAASDLRTGLPWQMVESHEPVRIIFIIETTPAVMTRIMDADEGIGKLCRNRWVRIALIHPGSGELSVFQGGEFRPYSPQAAVLPAAESSVRWYRGWRDHLEFAEIVGRG
ncbi:hypothetical protein OJF2_24780 [Aquisphaera giovannonii]|uniref:Probable inorganic carbon transporter subunit DabA n=1 Tax=Aquisphaera giovannonii TaxID=406548 RepID=A0A5B9VZT6_9BACT|nr:DUF2309 domain-containing protein [Aquisphaera giovannonii]QEH33946.1 hypothetical protein OJF2_24780 [Aquisphaera giovannonii]